MACVRFKSYFCLVASLLTLSAASPLFAGDELYETANRYRDTGGSYTPKREVLHQSIVKKLIERGHSSSTPKLIFTAGPPGAGKSTVAAALAKYGFIDLNEFIYSDSDRIKELIPEYEAFKSVDPSGAATLVHRESTHIAEKVFDEAIRRKKNIFVDTSFSDKGSYVKFFEKFRVDHPEYSTMVISVSAPREIMTQRVDDRGQVTGRFVPKEVIDRMARGSAETVPAVLEMVDGAIFIDNANHPEIRSIYLNGKTTEFTKPIPLDSQDEVSTKTIKSLIRNPRDPSLDRALRNIPSRLSARLSAPKLEISNELPPEKIADKLGIYLKEVQDTSEPPLKEAPDLFKEPIEKIIKNLEIQGHNNQLLSNSYLSAFHDQLTMQIKNAAMDAPGGRYAYMPSLHALRKAKDFYDMIGKKLPPKSKVMTLGNPADAENEISEIEKRDKKVVEAILRDPESYQKKLSDRLSKGGYESSFPEFADVLRYLEIKLSTQQMIELARKDPRIAQLRDKTLKILFTAKEKRYPYLMTINAMEDALATLDIVQRGESGSRLPPLYHSKVWQHYASVMKGQGANYVIVPTISELGFIDFLRTRAIPMGFVGVTSTPAYGDGHFQSPLEFWFHDFNHCRRMWQEQMTRAKELGLSLREYQKLSHQFITDEVLPLIELKPTDLPEQQDMKRLISLILFEISHEEALPLDRKLVKETLARPPLAEARFVYESLSEDMSKVAYSLRSTSSVLAFTFRKVEGEFYDMASMRLGQVSSHRARTRKAFTEAAKILNKRLKLGIDPDVLFKNVADDSGIRGPFREALEERSKAYPGTIEPFNEHAGTTISKRPVLDVKCLERALIDLGKKR
jgi:predicted ABC-type ATPase